MPDNAGYMHAAYAVATTAYALYALSLWRRRRAVRERLERAGDHGASVGGDATGAAGAAGADQRSGDEGRR